MESISRTFGREFSLQYVAGPGRNGGGGTYELFSGTFGNVRAPSNQGQFGRFWIYHTHASGSGHASGYRNSAGDLIQGDQFVLWRMRVNGSPQNISIIIPVGEEPFGFDVDWHRFSLR
jgi:hypothetical protein